MTATPKPTTAQAAGGSPVAQVGPFVLNLCSSTTPMALARCEQPELKRFSFFVSRRFEEGRERFRLHMGFFATLAEAEEWLGAVRDIYPGAWAGEAPGKKLQERAALIAAQAAAMASVQAAERAVADRHALQVPTLHPPIAAPAAAAPPVPGARVQPSVAPPRPAKAPVATAKAPVATAKAPVATAKAPVAAVAAPKTPVAAGTASSAATARAPGAARPSARAAAKPVGKQTLPSSNVREVLAALADPQDAQTGETRVMPAPRIGTGVSADEDTFSDTQVLKLLETRRPSGAQNDAAAAVAISLLKPDDTGTRRALKEAVLENAPVSFAVQLQWSVQPVELAKVPPLAIFSAYTLYTVEGSRDGRKWYGLRLGFFGDAISAKQVAYYVRSEFTSVAVVPVSPQERTRASDVDKKGSGVAFAKKARAITPADEFKLIDVDAPAPPQNLASRPANVAGSAAPPSVPAPLRRGGRVRARDKRAPQTLEETLEILGAGQLEIDDGKGESLNDSGVRHVRVEVQKNAPFSRLLERLSERIRKP